MNQNKYIFVYGSLVNPQELIRTLGHPAKTLHPVWLGGWVRDWSVVIDNSKGRQRFLPVENTDIISYVAALNVRQPSPGEIATDPNGVLVEVSEDDINKLNARESHYTLTDVTKHVIGAPEGLIYTYTGKEQFLITPLNQNTVVIPESYATLVLDSFSALGDDMHLQYLRTTKPTILPIRPSVFREVIGEDYRVDTKYFQHTHNEQNLEPTLGQTA